MVAASLKIDPSGIAQAIAACPPLLQEQVLQRCKTSNPQEAAEYVVRQIKSGKQGKKGKTQASHITNLFASVFSKGMSSQLNQQDIQQNKIAIWNLVQAIIPACFMPDAYVVDGEKFDKGIQFSQAWVVRVLLLLQDGLSLSGIVAQQDDNEYFLDEEQTYAYVSDGTTFEEDPDEQAKQLIAALSERYNPAKKIPKKQLNNPDTFNKLRTQLNANLANSRAGDRLFFAMLVSESDDVIDKFREYLDELLFFVCEKAEGEVDGFLLDNINVFNSWIAQWMIITGQVASMNTNQDDAGRPTKKREDFHTAAGKHLTLGKEGVDFMSKLTQLAQSWF